MSERLAGLARFAGALWRCESGQATTEYMILLALLVSLFMSLFREVLLPILQALADRMEGVFVNRFSRGLHQFRVR
jgi:hypothetical protein